MMDMTSSDDPSFVYGPRLFRLNAKIVGWDALLQLRGRGSFGEVWAAETDAGKPVALKFLPCDQNRAAVQELRSIQMVRQLSQLRLECLLGLL